MRSCTVPVAALIAVLLVAPLVAGGAQQPRGQGDVLLATTTSLYDTGLLDSLAPLFERQSGYRLRVVAVGSGQALRMAERGDADVLLAHSPAAEEAFMLAGFGVRRLAIASNLFTIVGPPDDPARARSAPSAPLALRQIADSAHRFVSRGDSSGTHQRELALWRAGGGRPTWPGYLESGQGMAATLLIAEERRAYALTDRATLAALRRRLTLEPLRGAEPALLNVYHVIEVSPAGRPRVNAAGARALAEFLVSPATQDLIGDFGRSRFGEPLFTPLRGREPSP